MKATAENSTIGLDVLIDYLTGMYTKPIILDKPALKKLAEMNFATPVDFANFCFQQGWQQSVKHMLQTVRPRNYEENKSNS